MFIFTCLHVVPVSDLINFEDDDTNPAVNNNSTCVPLVILSKRRLLRWRQVCILRVYQYNNVLLFISQSVYWLFQSEPYNHVISRLEIEIETGRIIIHKDKRPHSDIGARQKLLELLQSYNPVWLRLGLEVRDKLYIPYSSIFPWHTNSMIQLLFAKY